MTPTDAEITALGTELLEVTDLDRVGEIAHQVITTVWKYPRGEAFVSLVAAVLSYADEVGAQTGDDPMSSQTLLRIAADLLASAASDEPERGEYET